MNHLPANSSLSLARWRNVPAILMGAGAVLALLGFLVKPSPAEFAYAWLLAFMFFLSLCAGALFLVMAHHLFDASWSVPIRRICEHIAALLFPWMALLFIPVAIFAKSLYPWLSIDPNSDHALGAKQPLFSTAGFYVTSAVCFLVWWLLSARLRFWSVRQDQTGGAAPTYKMRFYSCIGIFLYAISVTLGVVMWMKSLQHQWFSTMYGVYFFAGSVWMTLATIWVVTAVLERQGALAEVLHQHHYYYIGSLLFAFTVFYAYIHFAQYFIIWNGNLPEETFWYILRERGTWWWAGMVIIFGHFFVPFLALLRIDVKSMLNIMVPLGIWAWLMHWVDLSFNILPVPHPDGYPLRLLWLQAGCGAFMAGLLAWRFLWDYSRHPAYPARDPRLAEAMGLHDHVPKPAHPAARPGEAFPDAPPQFGGTNR